MSNLIHVSGNSQSAPAPIEGDPSKAVEQSRELATAIQVAKADVITDTTDAALIAASHISLIESMLTHRVPGAADQLHQIARAGTNGLTDLVLKTAREVS